jgi:hypothetical protein
VLYHVGSVADITERKQAADEIRKLNASLEQRIAERTAELTASEARLRTIVDHAPEAIVVFDGDTARFLSSTCMRRNFTVAPPRIDPARSGGCEPGVSTGRAPSSDGGARLDRSGHRGARRRSSSGCINIAPAGSCPRRCGWSACRREGKNLLRGSIIDNTEHKRIEASLRRRGEQMQKHRDVLLKLARSDKSDFDQALRAITASAAQHDGDRARELLVVAGKRCHARLRTVASARHPECR